MILVTGASGKLGNAIVRQLEERIASDRIVAGTRDPDDLAGLGKIAVRRCDFADAASLPAAFKGAERLLIVSVDKLGDEARRLHLCAIDAARKAGVGRIFYTSHVGARTDSAFMPADQHAATEADLAESGVAYTSLRHGFYAESCLQMIGDDLKSGELRVPEDGPVSWTARGDLAEADAVLLATSDPLDGPTPPLTASRALTMAQIADVASEVTGRAIRHTIISDDDWKSAKIAAGVSELYADMLLGTFRAAREGDFAATDPELQRLIGRKPTSMEEVLASTFASAQ